VPSLSHRKRTFDGSGQAVDTSSKTRDAPTTTDFEDRVVTRDMGCIVHEDFDLRPLVTR